MKRRTQRMLIVFAVLLTAAAALSFAIAPEQAIRGARASDYPTASVTDPMVTLAEGRMDQRLV